MMVKRVHRWADPTEYATDREYVAATHLFKITYKDRTGRKRSSIIRDYERGVLHDTAKIFGYKNIKIKRLK